MRTILLLVVALVIVDRIMRIHNHNNKYDEISNQINEELTIVW